MIETPNGVAIAALERWGHKGYRIVDHVLSGEFAGESFLLTTAPDYRTAINRYRHIEKKENEC